MKYPKMPIYEYKCTECDHRLEKLQKMSDDPLKNCPVCDNSSLIKLVSASSFKLKGSGWYETDFKNKKKPEPSKGESSKTESSSSKDKSTSDSSKSKTKSETKK